MAAKKPSRKPSRGSSRKGSQKKTAKKTSKVRTRKAERKIAKPRVATVGSPQRPVPTTHVHKCSCKKKNSCGDAAGWIYFLGIIGAAIYYIPLATGFWNIVLAVLKSLIWPTMLVLHLLGL